MLYIKEYFRFVPTALRRGDLVKTLPPTLLLEFLSFVVLDGWKDLSTVSVITVEFILNNFWIVLTKT